MLLVSLGELRAASALALEKSINTFEAQHAELLLGRHVQTRRLAGASADSSSAVVAQQESIFY